MSTLYHNEAIRSNINLMYKKLMLFFVVTISYLAFLLYYMFVFIRYCTCCFLFFYFYSTILPETLNKVVATVQNHSITSFDLEEEMKFAKKSPDQFPKNPRKFKSRVLDALINKEIIAIEAEKESIIVSPEKVNNQIKKEIVQRSIPNEKTFQKMIEKQFHIPWEKYKENLRQRIIAEELMHFRVSSPGITKQELKRWFAKNKKQIGDRYQFSVIIVPFNPKDMHDELRANKIIIKAKQLALSNFAKAASKYSKHPSARKGGDMGWLNINEVASIHPYLASIVAQTPIGKVSQEISIEGAYYLVKVRNKQAITFKEAEGLIRNYLLREKKSKAFEGWLKEAHDLLGVKIFLADYIKE